MADGGPYRFQQPRAGPYYYPQQHQQNHHQRHLARNGSPVNNGRGGGYSNDTPSPSRSPVSQATSHNPYGMYSQGHPQAQQMMMNGAGHQGYMQMNMNHKYQHQNQQQHHGQQNHHHQQNHVGGHGASMGHQHTFSSGTMSNVTPNFSSAGLHNSSTNSQSALGEALPEHWAHQLQLAAETRSHEQPHHHARKEGVVPKISSLNVELDPADGEECNRVMTDELESRQNWNSMDMSGCRLNTLSPPLFDHYGFLTRLYLDNNELLYLSTAIGQLRCLEHLDVSRNQLMAIPSEIGMLSRLRALLLFDNKIRELPAEIGLLYRLETLGIDGNDQLDEDQRTMMIEQGTKALVTHLREASQGDRPLIFSGPLWSILQEG